MLLYREAEITVSCFGSFLECRKCNIRISYNIGTCALPNIRICTHPRARMPLGIVHIYQAKHFCLYLYKYQFLLPRVLLWTLAIVGLYFIIVMTFLHGSGGDSQLFINLQDL